MKTDAVYFHMQKFHTPKIYKRLHEIDFRLAIVIRWFKVRQRDIYNSSITLLRHLPIYRSQQIITFSLSPHLSFTPNLRFISSSNHSRLILLAPLHSRFSGPLNLALFSFHITIIITASLIISFHLLYGLLLFNSVLE